MSSELPIRVIYREHRIKPWKVIVGIGRSRSSGISKVTRKMCSVSAGLEHGQAVSKIGLSPSWPWLRA